MKKSKISKIIGAIIIIGIVVGGGYAIHAHANNDTANKPIVIPITAAPRTMNPLFANSRNALVVTDALYEPVFNVKDNGDIVYNGLAESLTHSKDCKTYTLTLKKGLKWSDGQPLTANDLVFTFNKIMNPKTNSIVMQSFMINNKPVKIKKINDSTVEFLLPEPSLGFPSALSQLYPIPEHIYKDATDLQTAKQNEKPVGDAPYKFVSETPGSSVTLERNPYFFGEKAKIDKLEFRVIQNASASLAALESNQVSTGYAFEMSTLNNKKIKENYDVKDIQSGLVDNLVFNFNNKNLKNLKVRQAISYALNREDLIKAFYGNMPGVTKAYSVFPSNTQYFTDNVTKYTYDLSKAKEMMKESGEKDVTLNIIYMAGSKANENQALVVKQELAQIGIKVELKPMAPNAFLQELFTPNSHKYDLALNAYNMGTAPDGYASVFTTGGANNCSNFSNKEIDKLFNEAQTSTSASKRQELYTEIQQDLAKDIPIYTIDYPTGHLLVSKKLGGVDKAQVTPISIFNNFGELYNK